MKILFDLQALQNGSRSRGIGRYVKSLFDALAERSDIELCALINGAMDETSLTAIEHAISRVGVERVFVFPGMASSTLMVPENLHRWRLSQAAYEAFVAEINFDVLLVGSAIEGLIDGTSLSLKAQGAAYLKAVVIYDLIPLIDPEKYLAWDKAHAWYFDRISHVEAADLALAISESAREECLEFLDFTPDSVANISSAINEGLFNNDCPADEQLLASLGIRRPFIMHAGAVELRKNFDGLIRAFSVLPRELRLKYQLVLVGSADSDAISHLKSAAAESGLKTNDIVITGFIPDELLVHLYRACHLFVFPSFHEGFGLPALEAMACGCPTIGSNTTSIPEVIGNPDFTFDPSDTAAIAMSMQRLLTDERAWHQAKAHALTQAANFSWNKVASRTVSALRQAISHRAFPNSPIYPSAHRMVSYIANRVNLPECPDEDLEALSRSLAAAQDELLAKTALANVDNTRPWRIEGPFDSSYSLALVNRETARAMAGLGWQIALHSTEGPGDFPASESFLADNPDLAEMNSLADKCDHEGSFAVSRLLYPPRVGDMTAHINALHNYAWEESGFPADWVDNFNTHLSMITTLSAHVDKILIDNGVSVPLVTSGLGVDHWERIVPDEHFHIEARSFRFLHVSSCFPRKGVDVLLAAYGEAFSIGDDVTLIIKTFDNPHNNLLALLSAFQAANPDFPHVVTIFAELADSELKALYCQCQIMVGPSLAEGYGLPFAEAMLTGIPVITTAWGGQLDFCNTTNSWLVDYRFERARSHFGLWSSAWARPDQSSLSNAMLDAYAADPEARKAMAARGRRQLLARHQWRHVASRLTVAAATLPARPRLNPRIGWISTWHSKCGIATYSQHLVEAIPAEVTVFSPVNETLLLGRDTSIRCWRQSKESSELWRILTCQASQQNDVFIIQFNYGFYNHADLSRFIFQSKALGKTVIICLHSTLDPAGYEGDDNFALAWLASAFSACDRLLVHSIDDLNRMKAIGLVENVALFPHGVLTLFDQPSLRPDKPVPTISTYGFALPHKGLPEMLQALHILRNNGRVLNLRMVNAEYPVASSRSLINDLRQLAQSLGLSNQVEMHNRFLSDEDSLSLISDSDLVVFPYQSTAESASGAVRYGLASERPVAVTPLPIFSDLEGATFRFSGTGPSDLAVGIASALDKISSNAPEAVEISEQAARWRSQHSYAVVGRRLFNICKALTRS